MTAPLLEPVVFFIISFNIILGPLFLLLAQ